MLPAQIDELITILNSLPGLGKKSAQKISLDILNLEDENIKLLIDSIQKMNREVLFCSNCGFFASKFDGELCQICSKAIKGGRDVSKICLVEKPVDVLNLEKTLIYNGIYHVLGSLISPIDNIFATDTTIHDLFDRKIPQNIKQGLQTELILFLKPSFATDTTLAYLKELILERKLGENVKITQLAQGLPLYYNADNLDQATMIKALEDRRGV